jgi:uncharacterized Zn finger protein (UPF0148 family)
VIKLKEAAKKMAHLLKTGYTMLNMACPVCNNPVFRDKKGDIFCPICNRKVVLVDQKTENNSEKNQQSNLPLKDLDNEEKKIIINQHFKELINKKMQFLIQTLEKENNLDIIEKTARTLTQLIKLMRQVNKL